MGVQFEMLILRKVVVCPHRLHVKRIICILFYLWLIYVWIIFQILFHLLLGHFVVHLSVFTFIRRPKIQMFSLFLIYHDITILFISSLFQICTINNSLRFMMHIIYKELLLRMQFSLKKTQVSFDQISIDSFMFIFILKIHSNLTWRRYCTVSDFIHFQIVIHLYLLRFIFINYIIIYMTFYTVY